MDPVTLNKSVDQLVTLHREPAPIERVPNEILEKFLDMYLEDKVDTWTDYPSTQCPPLVKLTHVCRLWRQILLGRPQLWSHIPHESQKWAKIFIDRSRPLPIHLRVIFPTDSLVWQTTLFVPEIHRVASMWINGLTPPVQKFIDVLPPDHPVLDTLQIYGSMHVGVVVPASLTVNSPKLRHLELGPGTRLSNVTIPIAPSLQALACMFTDPFTLRRMLRNNPHLRYATFTYVPPDEPTVSLTGPEPAVSARNLERLVLTLSRLGAGTQFFRHLELPSIIALHMDISISFEVHQNLTGFSSHMGPILRPWNEGTQRRTLRSLQVVSQATGMLVDADWAYRFSAWTGPGQGMVVVRRSTAFFADRIDVPLAIMYHGKLYERASTPTVLCTSIAQNVPLSGVTTLTVDMDRELGLPDWHAFLRSLVSVESLVYYINTDISLLDAATPAPVGVGASSQRSFLFPHLKTLVITIGNGREVRFATPALIETLRRFADGRQQGDTQMEEISVRGNFDLAWVCDLALGISEKVMVTWNGAPVPSANQTEVE